MIGLSRPSQASDQKTSDCHVPPLTVTSEDIERARPTTAFMVGISISAGAVNWSAVAPGKPPSAIRFEAATTIDP